MCRCKDKWRGPTWGPRGRGARPRGGRVLHPHGHMVGPHGEFLVPIIVKHSRKNHIKSSRHLEKFYFRAIFIARIIQKTDIKYYFCFI